MMFRDGCLEWFLQAGDEDVDLLKLVGDASLQHVRCKVVDVVDVNEGINDEEHKMKTQRRHKI